MLMKYLREGKEKKPPKTRHFRLIPRSIFREQTEKRRNGTKEPVIKPMHIVSGNISQRAEIYFVSLKGKKCLIHDSGNLANAHDRSATSRHFHNYFRTRMLYKSITADRM